MVEDIRIGDEFHVVNDNLSIPVDGIIGMDFVRNYNCILDFDKENAI